MKAMSIPVQVGGGIRTIKTVSAYLSSGAERVVLGTAVVRDREVLEEACGRFPGRMLVGVDAQGGNVAVKGWTEVADQDAADFVGRLTGLAVYAVIYTDIARDGMLEGPNLEGLRRMGAGCLVPLMAAGGITRTEDLRPLGALGPKVEGASGGQDTHA